MNHKKGDEVRIRSKEWIDAQEKTSNEGVLGPKGSYAIISSGMLKYAGRMAKIISRQSYSYRLDIDDRRYAWEDWMFDPDYRAADGPLSAEDAFRDMLDGETLYAEGGKQRQPRMDGEAEEQNEQQ